MPKRQLIQFDSGKNWGSFDSRYSNATLPNGFSIDILSDAGDECGPLVTVNYDEALDHVSQKIAAEQAKNIIKIIKAAVSSKYPDCEFLDDSQDGKGETSDRFAGVYINLLPEAAFEIKERSIIKFIHENEIYKLASESTTKAISLEKVENVLLGKVGTKLDEKAIKKILEELSLQNRSIDRN